MSLTKLCAKIELILSDVDGVMTDGGIQLLDDGSQFVKFHIRDGMGVRLWREAGKRFGIVTGDRLVYAKGFGIRSKSGGAAVDPQTVFQIGSAAKGFLATTMAIAVDQGKLDSVVSAYATERTWSRPGYFCDTKCSCTASSPGRHRSTQRAVLPSRRHG